MGEFAENLNLGKRVLPPNSEDCVNAYTLYFIFLSWLIELSWSHDLVIVQWITMDKLP